ncbi:hypothetical protein IWW37_004571 [Coemansia sp. RSA 2050]|nr:hypothetical protein IWW37_004571 [Coemansia sp. RSA 2050]KAJ2735138.1 hypothetical protein IW152_001767 [Coemansia sp. BCRC 34962]
MVTTTDNNKRKLPGKASSAQQAPAKRARVDTDPAHKDTSRDYGPHSSHVDKGSSSRSYEPHSSRGYENASSHGCKTGTFSAVKANTASIIKTNPEPVENIEAAPVPVADSAPLYISELDGILPESGFPLPCQGDIINEPPPIELPMGSGNKAFADASVQARPQRSGNNKGLDLVNISSAKRKRDSSRDISPVAKKSRDHASSDSASATDRPRRRGCRGGKHANPQAISRKTCPIAGPRNGAANSEHSIGQNAHGANSTSVKCSFVSSSVASFAAIPLVSARTPPAAPRAPSKSRTAESQASWPTQQEVKKHHRQRAHQSHRPRDDATRQRETQPRKTKGVGYGQKRS